MRLTDFVEMLLEPNWLNVADAFAQAKHSLTLNSKESAELLRDVSEGIKRGDARAATNALFAGFVFDGPRFLGAVQKKGILRVSRHSYESEALTSIVQALLAPELCLSPETIDYLKSVSALLKIAERIREEYLSLREWLEEEREVGVKSALASLDLLFLKATFGLHLSNKDRVSSRSQYFFSVEELADGFSSLLALFANEFGNLTSNPAINEAGCEKGVYLAILNTAAHLSTFREWEFQVDRLGYRFKLNKDETEFRFSHPSPEFHRAIEMGFIQTTMQARIKGLAWMKSDATSFHNYAPRVIGPLEEAGLIELLEQPARRYRFGFPEESLASLAKIGDFFLEEQVALSQVSRDLLISPASILEFRMDDELSCKDIFLILRLFQFIRSIAVAKLLPELESTPAIVLQSLVPAYTHENLVHLLSRCVAPEAAEKAVALWKADITKHTDIHYWPLLPAGHSYLLPLNLLCNSNVYRNGMQAVQKRFSDDGSKDPLVPMLCTAFQDRGYKPIPGFQYKNGEIDLLVFIDGILFAFECKRSLQPTSPHELMTSLDYVREAGAQLERFKEHCLDAKFLAWLATKTGWPIDLKTHLSTAVVMSNRMFLGWRERQSPVRGAYELAHFVGDGTISMGTEFHRFWAGESMTGEDLRRFLEDDVTYRPLWDALRPFDERYEFADLQVFVERYKNDMVALAEHFGFEDAKSELKKQQAELEKEMAEVSLVERYRQMYLSDGERGEE